MSLPAQLAFMAIVGHRMLDRYQDLKVAFLEFGAEWIFYMVSRMDHYLPLDRGAHPFGLSMPNAGEPAAREHPRLRQIGPYFHGRRSRRPNAPPAFRSDRRRSCAVLLRLSPWRRPRQRRPGNPRTARILQNRRSANCYMTTPCVFSARRKVSRGSTVTAKWSETSHHQGTKGTKVWSGRA